MNKSSEKTTPQGSLSFLKFINEFFINYKNFLEVHLTAEKPPFISLIIWLLGICSTINKLSRNIYSLKYEIESWVIFWLIVLAGGIILGYLQYWIGGALYYLRVWLSGGIKNSKISRSLYLYTGIPIYVIVVLTTIFDNIKYGDTYFSGPTNDLLDYTWAILLIIGIIYSIFLSYQGVRLLLKTGFIRSIVFFVILPVMIYSAPLAWTFYQAFEPKSEWKHFRGGVQIVLEVESKGNQSTDRENANIIMEMLTERLRRIGIRKKIITIIGERRLIIQLPKVKNNERVIDLISKPYLLEFKLVDDTQSLDSALKGNLPLGGEILYRIDEDPQTQRTSKTPYLLKKRTLLTGAYLSDARVQIDSQFNEPYITILFDKKGARIFEKITGDNVNKRLAIVLDNNVYSAPVIQEKIAGGQARITGRFTTEEARYLAIALSAGAYPANTRVIESKNLTKDIWLGGEN